MSLSDQRILVAGASGLVGAALCRQLDAADADIRTLVRRSPASDSEFEWSPAEGRIDARALDGVSAVVHLGGANVADGRWTDEQKALIRDSRVQSTRLLAETIAKAAEPRPALLCASAIGYYGTFAPEEPAHQVELTEEHPDGPGLLGAVCTEWEAACEPARQAGARVVNLRIGLVLSSGGGALPKMLGPFRAGFGGVIGSGEQMVSWISLTDLVRAIEYVLSNDAIAGPVNAVSPQPISNRTFTKALGRVLSRPTLFPVPALAIRTMFGEMGEALLLRGSRVVPRHLLQAGFEFEHPEIEQALRAEIA